jgi:hypothetical protein
VSALPWSGDDRRRRCEVRGAHWIDQVLCWRPTDPDEVTTGDHETAVILLGGTFDLVGGGTAWPARGARPDPWRGRPMAVFLPPRTRFQVGHGSGELLLVSARQPVPETPAATGRATLAEKPLLPLAGSGKSFDPNSGEWKPAETFPTAPESLPPRRLLRIPVGSATIERVFAPDYKAATLSVDEVVVPAGSTLALGAIPGRPRCTEVVLFVRAAAGAATVQHAGGSTQGPGDLVLRLAGTGDDAHIHASPEGPAYVVVAYAGKGS